MLFHDPFILTILKRDDLRRTRGPTTPLLSVVETQTMFSQSVFVVNQSFI